MDKPLRTGGRRGRKKQAAATARAPDYTQLRNSLTPQEILSADEVATLHETALTVLEELGIRVLHAEGREIFARAGASVDNDSQMVCIDRGFVAEALKNAPGRFTIAAGSPRRAVTLGGNHVAFVCVGGAPYISDLDGGKRPGTLENCRNIIKLNQHFDVIHLQSPNVEPQDIPPNVRHYKVTDAQLTLSDKAPFVYARGSRQVEDGFEMIRIVRGLDRDAFEAQPWCYTVINTNSPRQLDIPMTQGIIDFARAGQMSVITPFTLAGAMAPVTLAGALVLQHAEALAGIALAQIVRPGAPVVYGSFTSNVDMKSGAPAFGTPEYVKAAIAGGQLARHIGLPWRGSAPNASNTPDAQATHETQMSMWGSLLGGVNMVVHAAGWLEGGLTASMEKYIIDIEMLQAFAELFTPLGMTAGDIGFDALAEVEPGGHFFGAAHTMERYSTAFYEPVVCDWRNFGQWTDAGAPTAPERANTIWKDILASFEPPANDKARLEELDAFVARRTGEGGAPPDS